MAGCTFPKACRQNKDLTPFSLISHCSEMWKRPQTLKEQFHHNWKYWWKLKVKKDKYILCNCHATSKSGFKLQQMPPQPPAAEVTLQCVGSWFSAISCPLQNTNCSTSPAFCTSSRPASDESIGCPLQNTNCSASPAFCTFSHPPSDCFFKISPLLWPKRGYWCCIFLT